MPTSPAAVRLKRDLVLSLTSLGREAPQIEVVVKLGRIQAQHLADALIGYAGGVSKGAGREDGFLTFGEDLTARPAKASGRPVKTLNGSIRLLPTGKRG